MPKTTKRVAALRALLAGLIHAILLILSFPPFSLWGMALLVPIPLFVIARDPKTSPVRAAFFAAVGASPAWLWTHIWIKDVSALGLAPLVIVLSAFTFLFVWVAARLIKRFGRQALLLPLAWVGVEFFRGDIFGGGYPWYQLAHPLIQSPLSVLAMPAAWGGVYLVSFLCALYAALLLITVTAPTHSERKRTGLIAAIVFASWVVVGLGLIAPEPDASRYFRFAAIQPDVPQDNREMWTVRQRYRDWLTLRDLTIASTRDPQSPNPLDAIIWPEGFVPGWTLDPASLATERRENLYWSMTLKEPDDAPGLTGVPSSISATYVVDEMLLLQRTLGIPMVVGSTAFDNLRIVDTDDGIEYQRDAMYNSAFVIDHGHPQPIWYDKLHLTPFGEVMPLISRFDWLEERLLAFGAHGMEFALSPGREARVLTVPLSRPAGPDEAKLATPICFEATIASVCRRLVFKRGQRRAGVMINMTNDGWFGNWDPGREAHLQLARWRCIELNTPMIRCANTGFSCLIDHRGQIINRSITPLGDDPREGYLIDQIPLGSGTTVYARVGDLFGWACFGLTLAWTLAAIFGRSPPVHPVSTTQSV